MRRKTSLVDLFVDPGEARKMVEDNIKNTFKLVDELIEENKNLKEELKDLKDLKDKNNQLKEELDLYRNGVDNND